MNKLLKNSEITTTDVNILFIIMLNFRNEYFFKISIPYFERKTACTNFPKTLFTCNTFDFTIIRE